jgi:hypothetical protein
MDEEPVMHARRQRPNGCLALVVAAVRHGLLQ